MAQKALQHMICFGPTNKNMSPYSLRVSKDDNDDSNNNDNSNRKNNINKKNNSYENNNRNTIDKDKHNNDNTQHVSEPYGICGPRCSVNRSFFSHPEARALQ